MIDSCQTAYLSFFTESDEHELLSEFEITNLSFNKIFIPALLSINYLYCNFFSGILILRLFHNSKVTPGRP